MTKLSEREALLQVNKSHQLMVEKLQAQIDNQKEVISYYQKALKDLRVVTEKLKAETRKMREALEEIQEGKGRYSLYRLTHASNTIDDMINLAKQALSHQEGK